MKRILVIAGCRERASLWAHTLGLDRTQWTFVLDEKDMFGMRGRYVFVVPGAHHNPRFKEMSNALEFVGLIELKTDEEVRAFFDNDAA